MKLPLWRRSGTSRPTTLVPVEESLLTRTALLWLTLTLTLAAAPHAREFPVWLAPAFIVIAGWRGFIAFYNRPLPPRWILLTLALLAAAGVLATYKSLLGRDPGVALLTVMTACKLLETRGLRDGVVLVFLGYLLVMSNLLFSQEMPMVAYLLVVVTLMLVSQMLIHRQHAGLTAFAPLRLAGKMVLVAIPVMLVLFVLFPRIPGPLWGLPRDAYKGRTGLSGEMEPGTISQLIQSGEVAFRVRFTGPIPPPAQRYWRGPVLWNFDGRRWTPRDELPSPTPIPFAAEGSAVDYAVLLEPSNRRWLFALDLPASLPPRAGMTRSFQLLRDQPVNEVYRYEVRSYPQYRTGELTDAEKFVGLRLPSWSNPRARQLAEEWHARDPRPEALVATALTLFREQPFEYTLTPPLLGFHSIDEFLFRTRQGFCEHYASAFVFLMRAAGVPARVMTGYQGGERNALGEYLIVRQSDAHAWAEVWLAERGWVRIDPTGAVSPDRVQQGLFGALPEAEGLPFLVRRGGDYQWVWQLALVWDGLNIRWNEWVLAYGTDRQKEFLSGLGFGPVDWWEMTVAMIGMLSGLGVIFLVWRWRSRLPPDPVARAWQRFCTRLARRGLPRGPHEGPLDFTERAAAQRPERAESIREIGKLYARLRYGASAPSAEVRRLQQLTWRFRA
ncbi:MAG: protein-glutamine gamma-glutamyltransferase [Pseudomonadota bacterium]|nr:protein-glutamine gamma-glutamyltransferase [Pseudomonadota bacterium]